MKRNFFLVLASILLVISALSAKSCGNREETVSCFPNTEINVVLNLNLPYYFPLQTVGGWVYVDEQQSGTRGLIIVRTTNGFKVYDRNAPHICPDSNTTLIVQDNIKIVCPKDNAEWILLTGQPVEVAQIAPKIYLSNYQAGSNILTIYD